MAQKKQRSLVWVISTIYLTTGFSGSVLAAIFILIGAIIISGAPHIISLLVLFLLRLAGFLLGLRMGVNYVCGRAFIKKEEIFTISVIVATIPIAFLLIFGMVGGFESTDAIVLVDSLVIFYAARYFLGKRAEEPSVGNI